MLGSTTFNPLQTRMGGVSLMVQGSAPMHREKNSEYKDGRRVGPGIINTTTLDRWVHIFWGDSDRALDRTKEIYPRRLLDVERGL